MTKPMTEEEFNAGIGSLKAASRIEIAICALAGRIALHGTTMSTEEVVDTFKALLAAHRAICVESFLGDVLLRKIDTSEDCDRFYAEGGKLAVEVLTSYVTMGDQSEKANKIAHNLYEHALKSEKKK